MRIAGSFSKAFMLTGGSTVTFRDGLLKARGQLTFIAALAISTGIIIYLEALDTESHIQGRVATELSRQRNAPATISPAIDATGRPCSPLSLLLRAARHPQAGGWPFESAEGPGRHGTAARRAQRGRRCRARGGRGRVPFAPGPDRKPQFDAEELMLTRRDVRSA